MLKKFKKIVLLFLIIVALTIATVLSIFAYINSFGKYVVPIDEAPKVDCIFVLGAAIWGKEPSPVLRDRLDKAYELYEAGKAEKIIVSGDNGQIEYNEVKVMKNYLVRLGVPEEQILQDHAGFNTYDSMYRANIIFQAKSMLICTNYFHIQRSLYLARRMGIEAYGYPATNDSIKYSMKYQGWRERASKLVAFWDVEIIKRKPKYGGETIPVTNSTGSDTAE